MKAVKRIRCFAPGAFQSK